MFNTLHSSKKKQKKKPDTFLALDLATDAVFKNTCPAGRNSVFNECLCKMDHCLDSLTCRCQHKLTHRDMSLQPTIIPARCGLTISHNTNPCRNGLSLHRITKTGNSQCKAILLAFEKIKLLLC